MPFFSLLTTKITDINGQIVSVIGGGGKTSLLQTLSSELAAHNLKTIVTSTTKIEPFRNIQSIFLANNKNPVSEVQSVLNQNRVILLAQGIYKNKKLLGVSPQILSTFKNIADVILVEADGARQRPLKTHKEKEPVIPVKSDTVIIVIGADCVYQPLNHDFVHRAELFCQKWGLPLDTDILPEIIAKEVLSSRGYLKSIPLNAKVSIFINKSDLNKSGAKALAKHLGTCCSFPIYWGSIKKNKITHAPSQALVEDIH